MVIYLFLCFLNLLSGLIDGHTHPVWVGDRVHEFAMKVMRAEAIFFFFAVIFIILCSLTFKPK